MLSMLRTQQQVGRYVLRSASSSSSSSRLIPAAAVAGLQNRAFSIRATAPNCSAPSPYEFPYTCDPLRKSYKYWNREESEHGKYASITQNDVKKEARILSLCDPENDNANVALHEGPLPPGATLLAIGTTADDFDNSLKEQQPNVIFVSPSCPLARVQLPALLEKFPTVEWVHARSAGIDFLVSDELSGQKAIMTNAKGQFSSSLAEYAMLACSYFAKNVPLLTQQKRSKTWHKFDVHELRGKTMGIVGYGDVGRAVAKLAKMYGMKIVALRRNPRRNTDEEKLCDVVYGNDKKSLNKLMSESDYIVCSAPSTVETKGMVNADAFAAVKDNAVFMNLGRGLVVDEEAMIKALKSGKLRGAALDVFIEEPLPENNELWELDNVLISPHNMDQSSTFMHEATEFFVNENLPRFLCAEELLNPVDKTAGY